LDDLSESAQIAGRVLSIAGKFGAVICEFGAIQAKSLWVVG
jgi:hypothetical protein